LRTPQQREEGGHARRDEISASWLARALLSLPKSSMLLALRSNFLVSCPSAPQLTASPTTHPTI